MKFPHCTRSAFTLIELLIVVAIIAILAAIAVPNFLEAQTRAKVSRTVADLRSVTTALESYRVDNNTYPIDGYRADGQAYWYIPGGPTPETRAGGLTSPIAYMTSNALIDPFRTMVEASSSHRADGIGDPPVLNNFTANDYRRYRYRSLKYTYPTASNSQRSMSALYGDYVLAGSGPNRTLDMSAGTAGHPPSISGAGLTNWVDSHMIYDPTNGTVSRGDIVRSQRMPQQSGGSYGQGV